MGKAALLFALAATITTVWLTTSMQQTNMDTQDAQTEAYSNQMARDLAIQGRKLALASWIAAAGESAAAPFQTLTEGGGDIEIVNYNVDDGVLDLTIRAEYEGAVHDLRSQYRWNPGGAMNAFQIKAAKVDLDINNGATLEIPTITLDDQALADLDNVLIQDLALANDLNEMGLGVQNINSVLEDALSGSGNSNIGIDIIDTADRLQLEQETGMFFPDQVESALGSYINANPGIETTIQDGANLPDQFDAANGEGVLRVKDDLTINGDFSGSGILVIEGNLIVPDGATFNWDGMVIVKPPAENQNPRIDFVGTVNINGGLIALHEAMPNSGHMDITTFRDMNGTWSQAQGPDRKLWYWSWCMYHKHDFTSKYGNSITYFSTNSSERIHEREIHLNETLKKFNGTDEVFFEIYNTAAHGRGSLTIELNGEARVSNPVAAGFESSVASPTNSYRSRTFKVNELKYMHLDILRLSSLRKMWDTGSKYPGCTTTSGPVCVGYARDRMLSLTLALYKVSGASEYKVYEASMYWHRRTDEIEAYNDKMEDLVSDLKSADYGLDIDLGANTTLTSDVGAIGMLMGDGASGAGAIHLGSWTAHWSPNDPRNPLKD
ncbi:MAG: hypothetical protein AAF564_01340 [Bacteroidota bacterium]